MPDYEAKSVDLKKKDNSQFTVFMVETNKRLETKTVIKTALPGAVGKFQQDVPRLELSLVAEKGSSLTAEKNLCDSKRDMIHSGLIDQQKAYMKCGDAAKMTAAKTLYHATKQYGLTDLRQAPRDTETGRLDGLLDTVSADNFPAEFGLLKEIPNFTAALKAANDKYKELAAQEVDHCAAKVDYTTQDVRKSITPHFRAIINFCEIMANENVDPQYGEFITELNALIDQMK